MNKIKEYEASRVDKLFDKANEYIGLNRIESAITVLKRANRNDYSRNSGFYYTLGWCLNQIGNRAYPEDLYEAEIYLERAIKMDPNHADYHYELGECLLKLENYEGALASFKTAVDINPKSSNYRERLQELLIDAWQHGIDPEPYYPKWDEPDVDFGDEPSLS